ncbi:hypothetical protein F5Y18DRAFT_193394 [Xylariaceae sp. FL1019]|nr:hypothetical protein F5Y18DRAFT_193394 [Xylariaceae sp. FL1019]
MCAVVHVLGAALITQHGFRSCHTDSDLQGPRCNSDPIAWLSAPRQRHRHDSHGICLGMAYLRFLHRRRVVVVRAVRALLHTLDLLIQMVALQSALVRRSRWSVGTAGIHEISSLPGIAVLDSEDVSDPIFNFRGSYYSEDLAAIIRGSDSRFCGLHGLSSWATKHAAMSFVPQLMGHELAENDPDRQR